MTDALLVLNTGSSSIKCGLYAADGSGDCLGKIQIDRVGSAPVFRSTVSPTEPVPAKVGNSHAVLLAWVLPRIRHEFGGVRIVAAGHRVVHGGRDFAGPVLVTDDVLSRLRALSPLAPGHQPHNLAGIEALEVALPDLPQVACFDTAFHRTQPRMAQLFALPRALLDDGVLRYGFHGLSYDHIASVLPEHLGSRAEGRVIVAHLGNGASMCAMQSRKSIATSMGYTALDGLVMGRRCGELDPGVVLHLIRDRGMSVEVVEDLLTRKSGLLGVSGLSEDMRDLLASDHPHAREAVDLFVYRAIRRIGSLSAVLSGLDAIVFTGGIGEHSPLIRERILDGCSWLGVHVDRDRNLTGGPRLSTDDTAVAAFVIPTDEERVIARQTTATIAARSGG